MEKIRIITDSAADLDNVRPEVTVIPMKISFGSETYLDGVNLSHREFYEKLVESDALPVTSLVSPGEFSDVFEKAAAAGEKMLVITISGDLSGTYQSALLAAEEYAGRIRVIDSRQATVGEQLVVNRALQLMDNGLGLDAIADRLEAEKEEIHTIGLLDTLEYLKKGGRISKTVAFVGGALAIKPVVAIVDGKVILLGKARGSKNGENFLMREAEKAGLDFSRPMCLGYTGFSDAMLQKYMEDSRHLWEGHEDSLPICTIGATIGTHIGPIAIALSFFEKKLDFPKKCRKTPPERLFRRRSFGQLVLATHLSEAIAAVYGTIGLGLEGNLGLTAAAGTGSSEELTGTTGAVLASVTAGLAALGLVLEATLCVEFLFTGGENEFLAALFAN